MGKDLVSIDFESCVEECLQKTGCKAVNFVESDFRCNLYDSGIASVDAPKNTYDRNEGTVHALVSCLPKKPTGPVGCGRQAPAYQPIIKKFHRIIGGTEAKSHSWPWLVSMKLDYGNAIADCGASLIRVKDNVDASDILLTAAHCVTEEKTMLTNPQALALNQIEVIAGNHRVPEYDDGEERRQVSMIRFHSNFLALSDEAGAVNDLALVKLQTPIQFTDTIRPICLPTAGEALPVGRTCVTAGWGRTSSDTGDTPESLQQLLVPVHDAKTCNGNGTGWGSIYKEDLMVCAGSLQGKSGTCKGDSGGSLVCQQTDGSWRLYGATSFGVPDVCVGAGKPGVFTRISSYMDWITKNAQEMSSVKQ